LSIGLIVIVSV